MTPAARVAAAIDVLDRWRQGTAGMDTVLAQWARANRYAGSGDRAVIAGLAYDALRRRRSLSWRSGLPESGRALMLAAAPEAFTGVGHAPPPPDAAERAALERPEKPVPEAVRLDWPDWLMPAARDALGDETAPTLAMMRERAPLDLRVNAALSTRDEARAALAGEGIACEPLPLTPWALRAPVAARITRTAAYQGGAVEIQDVSSQTVAMVAAPRGGETVLDYCAGGGGKALALAAMTGETVLAHDIAPRRMKDLPARAARAGARVRIVSRPPKADLVLVDAPCSGSGAWRRNPDAKWRLTPARLAALNTAQDEALAMAAALVRPGGRLVYATCSILPAENTARVTAFLTAHPAFEAIAIDLAAAMPAGPGRLLTPLRGGGDGFFVCVLRRG